MFYIIILSIMSYRADEYQVFLKTTHTDWTSTTEAMPVRWVALVRAQEDWWEMESRFIKVDFRKHRHYNLPKELDFDWDAYDEWDEASDKQIEFLNEHYYRWFVDCYDHSAVSFSIQWEWMQCRWDTARKCGIIACPKEYCWYDFELWCNSIYKDKEDWPIQTTEQEAYKECKRYLAEFTERANWWWPLDVFMEYEETYQSIQSWDTKKLRNSDWDSLGIYYSMDRDEIEWAVLEEAKRYLLDNWIVPFLWECFDETKELFLESKPTY